MLGQEDVRKQKIPADISTTIFNRMGGIRNDNDNRKRRVIASSNPYNSSSNARDNGRQSENRNNRSSGNQSNNSGNNRVYVGNLKFEVSWQDLKDHMKSVGTVLRADIMTDLSGRSKGCGIVEYASAKDANTAIRQLTDTDLGGRLIFVREDRENGGAPSTGAQVHQQKQHEAPVSRTVIVKQEHRGRDDDSYASRGKHQQQQQSSGGPVAAPRLGLSRFVYVGNLSYDVVWQDLKDHMKTVGEVVHADVMLEPSGRSKGCGLVEFVTVQDANKAIKQLQDTDLKGRLIFVREDRERGDAAAGGGGAGGSGSNTRLYVGNLDFKTKWFDLKDHFKRLGAVKHADVATEDDGVRSKGYGIVEYESSADADAAVAQLNGTTLNGRQIFVREDREEKRRY